MSVAWIVVDLGFGDAGKGTLTDFLVRETRANLVVRFNGGAQAGHTVVTDDGRTHTFSQFGAGSFVPRTRTHLSEHVVVHPSALLVEAAHLKKVAVPDALERLSIAESARIITPFHQAANRAREIARGVSRHGTCGVGVGETVRDALEHPVDAIRARDLQDPHSLERKAHAARERLRSSLKDEFSILGEAHPELTIFANEDLVARWAQFILPVADRVVPDEWLTQWIAQNLGDLVLEGAQGVLLDENVGFHPHTTWSDCTANAAVRLLKHHGYDDSIFRFGVLRTYSTRHGQGPFPTESDGLRPLLTELHNENAGWQGSFRVGHPDLVLARYAIRTNGGIDALALTHVDRWMQLDRIGIAYENASDETLFVHDEHNRAIDLRDGDLAQQECLSNALRNVRVVYDDLPATVESRIEQLEGALATRVKVASAGTTASAKRWR